MNFNIYFNLLSSQCNHFNILQIENVTETFYVFSHTKHLKSSVYFTIIEHLKSDVIVHTCNPRTQEAKAEGQEVRGKPGLHNKTLSRKIE